MKRLLLTKLDPLSESGEAVPIGPWALSGEDHRDVPWERFGFRPPIPPDRIAEAARAVDLISDWLLDQTAAWLNERHGCAHSRRYWRILLMGWIAGLVQTTFERFLRVRDRAEAGAPYEVFLAPAGDRIPVENTRHFQALVQDDPAMNRFFFSRIIEALRPRRWSLREGSPAPPEEFLAADRKRTFKLGLLHWFSTLVGNLGGVHFHNVAGLHPREVLFLSLRIGLGRALRREPGLHVSLAREEPEPPARAQVAERLETCARLRRGEGEQFLQIIEGLARELLPRTFDADFRRNERVARFKAALTVPWVDLVLCGPVLGKDEPAKFYIAHLVERRGAALGLHQHGAGYGMIETHSFIHQVEYRTCDLFLSWGWETHAGYGLKAVPVPSPMLSKWRRERPEGDAPIILIGDLPPLYPIRIESNLYVSPEQTEKYRADKLAFVRALGEGPRAALRFRPYMHKNGFLYDEKYMKDRLPNLETIRGPRKHLLSLMRLSKLCVVDYPGTAFLETMAAGIPTLLFWDENVWRMGRGAREALEELKRARVFHSTAQGAAAHLNAMWPEVEAWWSHPVTREAVGRFCRMFARTSGRWQSEWAALFPVKRDLGPARPGKSS